MCETLESSCCPSSMVIGTMATRQEALDAEVKLTEYLRGTGVQVYGGH